MSDAKEFGLVQLSELAQTSIPWRWPQRIPTGMVTVLAGYQKTGKSLVACNFAATITRGRRFPAGEGSAKRGHVIIINNEDDPRQMLGPRLAAAGADLHRIHVPNSRWFLNRTNLIEKLESEIKKIQHLRALILDPITSLLSISRNNADDVRAVLTGLGSLAARYRIAIIAVVHLNKSGRGQAISQISGSFEWTAACRAAFLVTHDADGGRHLFLPLPNNVGLKREGLAFHVADIPVQGGQAPAVIWDDELVKMSADEALAMKHR